MTRKDQIKISSDKIESNTNQYKVDGLNAEISAFLSGDLNKYEFLTRKDLKYKPNALDKAKFEFSPLGKVFSTGLDKTSQGYQEEGVIKLLKNIRDGLAGGVNRRPDDNRPDDNRPDDRFDDDGFDHGFHDNGSDTIPYDTPYTSDDEDDIKNNFKKYDNLLLKHFQLRKNMKKTKDELDKTKDDTSEETKDDTSEETKDDTSEETKNDTSKEAKDELDKTKDDTSEKSYDSHGFDKDGFYKDTDGR